MALRILQYPQISMLCTGKISRRVPHHEDNPAAAGFIVRPANRFVQRQHVDTVHYVYADPLVCGCL